MSKYQLTPNKFRLYNVCNSNYTYKRININNAILSLDSVAPTINLETINNTFTSNLNRTFNYNTSENGICSLYLNTSGTFGINQTNNSVISGSNNFVVQLSGATSWLWNVECNDSVNNSANATNNFILTVDTTNPQINFSSLTQNNNTNKSF